MAQLILASAIPRRQQLLARIGVSFGMGDLPLVFSNVYFPMP